MEVEREISSRITDSRVITYGTVGSRREGKAEGRRSEATEMYGTGQGRRDCEGGRRVMGG